MNPHPTSHDIFNYEIQVYDTLQGIALEFKVSMQTLKKLNNLSSDTIIHLKTLKIPITELNKDILKNKTDKEKSKHEETLMLIDILAVEFKDFERIEIEFALEDSGFDIKKARKLMQEMTHRDIMVNHIEVKLGVSEQLARELLVEAKWNYKKAEEVYKSGKYKEVKMVGNLKGKLKID